MIEENERETRINPERLRKKLNMQRAMHAQSSGFITANAESPRTAGSNFSNSEPEEAQNQTERKKESRTGSSKFQPI